MLKREDFNGKSYEEMAEAIQADLVVYADMVASIPTVEDCMNEEQGLMHEMDKIQEHLNTVTYMLPAQAEYDGKKYSKKDIATKIVYFLNKMEVKWEHTLGLYELVSLWRSEDFKEIPYGVYDSTLRGLNTVTFKGYQEWQDILAINAYLAQNHNEYSLDTGMLVYLSNMHNMLLNRIKELDPQANVPESMEQ